MIEDLPEGVLNRLQHGRITPVMPIKVKDDNGSVFHTYARMSLYRNSDGEAHVMFYPKLDKADLSRFDSRKQKLLNEGRPVVDDKTLPDGSRVKAYYQIDPDTNQVLSTPVAVIENNIKHIAAELKLTQTEQTCLTNGRQLTTTIDDSEVTIGVNLNEGPGMRLVLGDERQWREQEKRDYMRYNFGLNGCWVANDEGGMDYVSEDDYTDDMWDEMKRRGSMQRSAGSHRL